MTQLRISLLACFSLYSCTVRTGFGPVHQPARYPAARAPGPVSPPPSAHQRVAYPAAQTPAPAAPASAPLAQEGVAVQDCFDPGPQGISDRFDQAHQVGLTSTTTVCFTESFERAMLMVQAPEGDVTILQYDLVGEDGEYVSIATYDQNRKKLSQVSERSQLEGWLLIAPGTIAYLQLEAPSDPSPAQLTLSNSTLHEPNEPNNSYEEATPIGYGSVKGYKILAASQKADDDWYRLDIKKARTLRFVLDMSQEIAPHFEVLDRNRKRVFSMNGSDGERIEGEMKAKPGRYYLRVYNYTEPESAGEGELPSMVTRPYELTVQ